MYNHKVQEERKEIKLKLYKNVEECNEKHRETRQKVTEKTAGG